MTKQKEIQLSSGEEAAIFLAGRITRGIQDWQDSGLFMTPSEILEDVRRLMVCLGDEFASWPKQKWKLLAALNELAAQMERDSANGGSWDPPRLQNVGLSRILRVCELTIELENPPAPPEPRRVPLESVDALLKAGVGIRQICLIHGWMLPNGEPDGEKFRKAECGEIQTPTHRTIPPVYDGPARQPIPYKLLGVAAELVEEIDRPREGIVEAVLIERDRQSSRVRPDDRQTEDHAHDDNAPAEHRQPAEQPRRPRGRPRKDVALAVRR